MKKKSQGSTKQQSTAKRGGNSRTLLAGTTARTGTLSNSRATGATVSHQFDEVLHLIQSARHRAFRAANFELIDLYWNFTEPSRDFCFIGSEHPVQVGGRDSRSISSSSIAPSSSRRTGSVGEKQR